MIPAHVSECALALPDEDRLALARLVIESVTSERRGGERVDRGVSRIEEVVLGRVTQLSEEEFRAALR